MLTREERETIISFNDANKELSIYTCNKTLQRELMRKGYRIIEQDDYSKTFVADKKFISFRTIQKVQIESTRKLTKEHIEKMQKGRKLRHKSA